MKVKLKSRSLPEAQREALTALYLKNEKAYWKHHTQLIRKYKSRWVVFYDDKVVADAKDAMEALAKAAPYGADAYVDKVGEEFKIQFRRRRRFSVAMRLMCA